MTKNDVDEYDRELADTAELVAKRMWPKYIERLWLTPAKELLLTLRHRNQNAPTDEQPPVGFMLAFTAEADSEPVTTMSFYARRPYFKELREMLPNWGMSTDQIEYLLERAEEYKSPS